MYNQNLNMLRVTIKRADIKSRVALGRKEGRKKGRGEGRKFVLQIFVWICKSCVSMWQDVSWWKEDLFLSGNLHTPFSHHAQNLVAEGAQVTKATTAMVAAQMMEVLAGADAAATTVEVQVFISVCRSEVAEDVYKCHSNTLPACIFAILD